MTNHYYNNPDVLKYICTYTYVCMYVCNIQYVQYVCIGYSPGWRQLWAYNTREIIGRGCSLRQLSQGCYMPITASKQGYMVTQKYAIKSHLTSLLSSRNHSTIYAN